MHDSKRSSTRVCAERDAPIAELQTMTDHVRLLVVHLLVPVYPQYDIHLLNRSNPGHHAYSARNTRTYVQSYRLFGPPLL
jgi:hypothetical protein